MNYKFAKAFISGFASGLGDAALGALAGVGALVLGAAMIDPEPAPPFIVGLYAAAALVGGTALACYRAARELDARAKHNV